jgi:hypothetical protein
MHTIQAFLIVVLSGFVWLTFILGLALAEEVTIYDRNWNPEKHTDKDRIYDKNWNLNGYIKEGELECQED